MINTQKREKIEYEMTLCIREYSRAQAAWREVRNRIADLALESQPIPDELRGQLDEAAWAINYYPNYLESLKTDYIAMIKSINVPRD